MDVELLNRACNGNAAAMDWLANGWSPYVHGVDDIIDAPAKPDPELVLECFARAAGLYTHPFFLANAAALRAVALSITLIYADSVAWEQSPEAWRRQWADHARHAGMEMVLAVALICGGYKHARAIGAEQRAICYADHHDREGNAI